MMLAALLLAAAVADPIAGTWEGTSLCQVKPSPCHDEHALYRFTKVGAQQYRIDGYKIVAGRELFMGPIDVKYDAALGMLEGKIIGRNGSTRLQLTRRGAHLSGRMTQPDGTVYRLIELTKR
jgi:hypothetical protein